MRVYREDVVPGWRDWFVASTDQSLAAINPRKDYIPMLDGYYRLLYTGGMMVAL